MIKQNNTLPKKENPPTLSEIADKIRAKTEELINYYLNNEKNNVNVVEKSLRLEIFQIACMYLQLYLMALQDRFDYSANSEEYYEGDLVPRTLKTIFGEVRYWRTYFTKKKGGGGFYPFDAITGLTSDGFSPLVMSLAAKLATRMSFKASVLVFKCFYDWAPSSEAVQGLVIGMGRDAVPYMEQRKAPENDGEVLVIEVDGKATPTATEGELKKRRGPRKKNTSCCNRHCNKDRRSRCHNRGKNKKKGDKRKNGRSITLVVMYTLKRGEDGKLHGPINKQVWGSYSPRKVMLAWAKEQASKRGFPEDTKKRVHIVIDGELCLYDGLIKLFPNATFALDIRHLEEKIWKVGRKFHKKGSKELEAWASAKIKYLYTGKAAQLITELKKLKLSLSARANRDKVKRDKVSELISYMEKRPTMMKYKQLIEEDMVIASGIVEGAARYVVGERMDCGGMRWIPERAEALLKLRCIELNGDWDKFFDWGYQQWVEKMKAGEKVIIRSEIPEPLDTAESVDDYFFECILEHIENDEILEAA
jgi:hypothetical protein